MAVANLYIADEKTRSAWPVVLYPIRQNHRHAALVVVGSIRLFVLMPKELQRKEHPTFDKLIILET